MANTRFSGPVISDNGFVGAFTGGTTNLTLSGNLQVAGVAALNIGLTMDTDKFVVANATGNTTVGGTLDVTGAATLANAANVLVIPTTDPGVENALWLDGSTIKVSAGS
jgi:hypothetical protein